MPKRASAFRPLDLLYVARKAMKQQSLAWLPVYLRDRRAFGAAGGRVTDLYPILNEFVSSRRLRLRRHKL